ncbi:hypothetical protein L207DRAFT_573784, partial [Hyaloscypha variabilis F]
MLPVHITRRFPRWRKCPSSHRSAHIFAVCNVANLTARLTFLNPCHALAPPLALNMQDFSHENDFANEEENLPTFGSPSSGREV